MDESWRRRQPTIQPHQDTDYLGPDDFRDVFGGPPRSVLLRHFSPSTQDAESGFRTMTNGDNSPYNTVFCRPDFAATIRCSRNGFHVNKREVKTANDASFYQPSLAISNCYGDNKPRVMKVEKNLPCGKILQKLDDLSMTSSMDSRPWVMKKEKHTSLTPDFHKQNSSSRAHDGQNSFQFMQKEDGSWQYTMSCLNAPKTYNAYNGIQFMKHEVEDVFSGDAFVHRPILGQHGVTWSGNNTFQALRREEAFYDDIFRSDSGDNNTGIRRSRSRSISKSESESTVLSCCDDGFLANAGYVDEGDRTLASFASKLRFSFI